MRTYLRVTGWLFALFAAGHVFILFEHARQRPVDPWAVAAPTVVALMAALLALWAFRLLGRLP